MMEHAVCIEKKKRLYTLFVIFSCVLYVDFLLSVVMIVSPLWLKIAVFLCFSISPILMFRFLKSSITKERMYHIEWDNWSDSSDFMFPVRLASRKSQSLIVKIIKIVVLLLLAYFVYVDIFRVFTLPIACLHLGFTILQIANLMRLLSLYKNYQIFFYKTRIVSHEALIPAVITMADIKKYQFIPTSNGRWLLEINTGVFYQCFDLDLEKKVCLEAILES